MQKNTQLSIYSGLKNDEPPQQRTFKGTEWKGMWFSDLRIPAVLLLPWIKTRWWKLVTIPTIHVVVRRCMSFIFPAVTFTVQSQTDSSCPCLMMTTQCLCLNLCRQVLVKIYDQTLFSAFICFVESLWLGVNIYTYLFHLFIVITLLQSNIYLWKQVNAEKRCVEVKEIY